jgi:hypothetical protein
MQIIEIYTGNDGKSHVRDYNPEEFVKLASRVSGPVNVPLLNAVSNRPGGFFVDWHPGGEIPGVIVCLTGTSEYEAEDGGWRRLKPGDLVILNSNVKRGFRFRVIGNENRLPLTARWNP